jgi:nucleotide-binding universal stress UspA family protein
MGSTSDFSLREAHMTAVIVKHREVARGCTFLVAVDGSDTSHEAAVMALKTAGPEDHVTVLHVEVSRAGARKQALVPSAAQPACRSCSRATPPPPLPTPPPHPHPPPLHPQDLTAQVGPRKFDADAVEARYKEFVAQRPNTDFRRVLKGRDETVAEAIINFAAEAGAAVMLIGADGMGAFASGRKVKLGSTSDAVVRKCPCTVVCVQHRQHTF